MRSISFFLNIFDFHVFLIKSDNFKANYGGIKINIDDDNKVKLNFIFLSAFF
jgi:hypothetical protein